MRFHFVAMLPCALLLLVPAARADELPDLKAAKVEITAYSADDAKQEPLFNQGAIVAAAETDAAGNVVKNANPPLVLPTYRSYRLIVTVQNVGKGSAAGSFTVKTECIRKGQKPVTLGKTRVHILRATIYACYDIFPAEAGDGECLIRTTIDSDNEIKEADERASSNTLDFKANIPK